MKKTIGFIMTGLMAVGIGVAVNQQPAHAAGYKWVKTKNYNNKPYHAKDMHKNAYIWNSNLTKKRYKLNNHDFTTWYVSKSIKMVKGNRSGIFYKVTSDSGKMTGYVWRGYVTKGYLDKEISINATAAGKAKTRSLILDILNNTVPDKKLQKFAEDAKSIHTSDNNNYFLEKLTPEQQKGTIFLNSAHFGENTKLLNNGKWNYEQYLKTNINIGLKDYGKTIADVKGYHIAMVSTQATGIWLVPNI